MSEQREYRFVIDAYSPDTLPMARLAEYMGELARLLGTPDQVHFVRLEEGSAVLVQRVEPEAAPDVKERLHALQQDNPPDDAARSFVALNRYLADDNATGILQEGEGADVIRFPGGEEPAPVTFGAFNQTGVLDGVLIRIGGRDDTVPAHLRDGETIHLCNATREMARRLCRSSLRPTPSRARQRTLGTRRRRRLGHEAVQHHELRRTRRRTAWRGCPEAARRRGQRLEGDRRPHGRAAASAWP